MLILVSSNEYYMTENLTFTKKVFPYANYPFPPEIANDPMVLYHASSSCYEKEIEREGLKYGKAHFTLEELQSVVNLFEKLGWMGKPGSMSTLKPFSINHDNKRHGLKPIYLGRTSFEVVNYASHQSSGGEIAKAVRFCFQDLQEFFSNEELRSNHTKEIQKKVAEAQQGGYVYDPPIQKISLEELGEKLSELDHINQRAISLFEKTDYGIVYAVRFSEKNSKDLLNNNWMGIKCFKNISPDQIIAKAKLPKNFRSNHSNNYNDSLIPSETGILKLVQKEN